MSDPNRPQKWLSLKKAADRLNIHPSTLRRWADQGDIPFMLTPGGHRRFDETDVEQFANRRKMSRSSQTLAQSWADKALQKTRSEIPAANSAGWMSNIGDSARERHRILGQKLMGLTLQFISATEENHHLLDEATLMGHQYGRISQQQGMTLTEALEAMIFFRDRLVEVALQMPETTRISPAANLKLMKRINTLLNQVHLAIAAEYEVPPAVE